MIERHRITTFGVSPTAIRVLSKSAGELPPMDSLRLLGSTGEPWDDKSWLWFFERVGRRRCPIINISGGTEIAGSFLFPLPIQPLKPCTLGGPAPGMATEVVDENGVPVRGRKGYLVCTAPAPSMTRGIWGDPKRYLETYWSRFPGMWYHGDWASVDEDGHWFVHGRADESMNVAGRKVGPAEVEEAMMQHPGVAEAAVIGVPDDLKGEAIVGYAVAKPGVQVDPAAVARTVVEVLGPTFRPQGNRGGRGVAENAERQNRAAPDSPEVSRRRTGRSIDGGESRSAVAERSTIEPATVRTSWRHFRAFLALRIRYKITRGGVLFTFAILLVAIGAAVSANNLLFLIVAAMMATLLVSGLVSRLCLAGLALDFQVPEHIPAGRSVPARLFVRNHKWFLPSFSIRVEAIREEGSPTMKSGVYFPLIAAGATLDAVVDVRFPKRGAYRQNGFAFSTSFPFGFLEKTARVTLTREMVVYPAIDPQPGFDDLLAGISGEIESHYRGLGRDFYRIRPYEAFESSRHVDWKASAHVGNLQIREFARELEQTVEIFLDRDVPARTGRVVRTRRKLLRLPAPGGSPPRAASIHFRSNGYEFRQPEDGDIYTILKYLALVYPQRVDAPEGPLNDASYKIVFTPTPRAFRDAGWMQARLLGPDVLPAPAGGTDAESAER